MHMLMRTYLFLFLTVFFCTSGSLHAQRTYSYTHYLENNPKIQWAIEVDAVANLSPASNTISLKNYFFEKLSSGKQLSYVVKDGKIIGSYIPPPRQFQKQEWLDSYYVRRSEYWENWNFHNKRSGSGFRVSGLSNDSCCGCDDYDAFLVKQVISYSNRKFDIKNMLLAPLCARKVDEKSGSWYMLGWFGYNESSSKPKNAIPLTTTYITYEVDPYDSIRHFDLLTVGEENIMTLLFKDLTSGNLKAVDPETQEPIPTDKILTWGTTNDTVAVDNGFGSVGYVVTERVWDPLEFKRLRLVQEWWFDPKRGKLYSTVKKAIIIRTIYNYEGGIRGHAQFMEIKY
jgi:hypothetical protein